MAIIQRSDADTAGFIPQIWALRALEVLRANITLAKLVTRDSDWETFNQGKSLTIPYPGTFTSTLKAAGVASTPSAPSGAASVTVTLSSYRIVEFEVEDVAAAQSNSELMLRYITPSVIALCEGVEQDLMSYVNAANFTSTPVGTLGTAMTSSTIRSAKKVLTDNKIAMRPRYLITGTGDTINFLADPTLANFFNFSRPGEVEEGALGNLYGFNVFESQLVQPDWAISSAATGSFTLSYGGQTTSTLTNANLTAAAVQTALVALSSVGTGNATVTGTTWTAGGVGTFHATFNTANCTGTQTLTAANVSGTTPTLTAGNNGFAFNPQALILATRPLRDIPAGYGAVSATEQDPVSGLFIRVLHGYAFADRAMRVSFEMLYGISALRDKAGLIVRS